MGKVLLLGTVETKAEQIECLSTSLGEHGLIAVIIDLSLGTQGKTLDGAAKIAQMTASATAAAAKIGQDCTSCVAAIGIGGGTGSEIVLAAMKALPASYPKVLITTLAFDPRAALADTAITLVPTLCDIEGLNPALRQVFENTSAMVAGLAQAKPVEHEGWPDIAVTTLGTTAAASRAVATALASARHTATVFHANGFGGAAFARFVTEGHAAGVIDLNVHELGRIRLAGAHVPMPNRFACADGFPRVVLPGGLNFIGLGLIDTVPDQYLERPHYRHSGHFTHIILSEDEMRDQAQALADALNSARASCHVILPMGGFSSEDRPGGAIESPQLRHIAADILEAEARAFTTARVPDHINTDNAARAAVDALLERMPHG